MIFDDEFGQTTEVLNRLKDMTRRKVNRINSWVDKGDTLFMDESVLKIRKPDGREITVPQYCQPYFKIGDVVAVTQTYEQMANSGYLGSMLESPGTFKKEYTTGGWTNKRCVRSELMPHKIRITGIKIERLKDISDEDCLREGVRKFKFKKGLRYFAGMVYLGEDDIKRMEDGLVPIGVKPWFRTPKEAYKYMTEKNYTKEYWKSNPFVFAYSFDLIQ